jgi:poly(3-hydroxybutyrate) depolymerase
MRSRLLVSVALVAFVGGCASSQEVAPSTVPATVPSTTLAPTTTTGTNQQPAGTAAEAPLPDGYDSITTSDGRVRNYRVVDLSDGEPAALLFVLHGFGGTAEAMRDYAGFERELERVIAGEVIVVYPNGSGAENGYPQSWNAGGCCPFSIYEPVDDVVFFAQLIDTLSSSYDIDPDRVWVAGHSNGGMMAYRLACELADRVTAIGVGAGALMIDSCQPARGVSAIHVHGELDSVVPIAGGETAGIVFPSAQQSFERFAGANSCALDGKTATCAGGRRKVLETNDTWTHDWQAEWTSLIVKFFAEESRGT